ncbi:MAG: hypothetical protein JWR83_3048 [Aeromicrobium sp.]|nr:hypothetical protein [Aeromicrobium sp.]
MPVVVATRTKMRKYRYVPGFTVRSVAVARQARRSPGFLGGRLLIGRDGTFWTLTVWESGRNMVDFRDTGLHAKLMPRMAGWASESLFGLWNRVGGGIPTWDEVSLHVAEKPNFLELQAPSPSHRDGHAPGAPKVRFVVPIPVRRTARSRP